MPSSQNALPGTLPAQGPRPPGDSSQAPADAPALARRLCAMLYEGVLLFGVLFISGYLFDTLTQSRTGLAHRDARQLFLFLVLGLYFTWFWTHSGQTLAMKTWHIRLVDRAGQPVRIGRALARYVLCWCLPLAALALLDQLAAPRWTLVVGPILAFALPPFWMLFDRKRQFIHDRLAGTQLITAR